ncbi:AraC family transcriptional regulator [Clostridium fallax]|uniref:Transcriptional regulator, AraC family n=1 Tax=Clostridium fallax TaxID=1533 RepID=A0A1M4YAV7_9CLOT|nr:AraC family transcriptional regulator [Clostridium fallax]SHF02931.1 transcriptional regulator, AraC family [Clostridium fallax]SQB05847.1 transcriptional regulator [Clostridium fallax]
MSKFETYVFNNENYIDLKPVQFGSEQCDPLHSIGPTVKNNYLFHYVISGKGKFFPVDPKTFEKKYYEISAGEGFLICPNVICSYQADEKDPWHYIWIEFNGLKSKIYMDEAGLNPDNPIFKVKENRNSIEIIKEMKSIVSNSKKNPSFIVGHLYLFINSLIEFSLNSTLTEADDLNEFYIREALNFIEENYNRNISVEDISKRCNLSKSYFTRIFKKHMNITPQEFLIHYKMMKACNLLKDKTLSISYISELLGYSNQFNFSVAFKKRFNLSPSKWRTTFLNNITEE